MTETLYYITGFIVGAIFGWTASIVILAWHEHRHQQQASNQFGTCYICGDPGVARFRVIYTDRTERVDISACLEHFDAVRSLAESRAMDV